MDQELIIKLVGILVTLLIIAIFLVESLCYLKQNTLEQIRVDVYQLFLKAEHLYEHGQNADKFKFVIRKARDLLPGWARFIITDSLLDKTIEAWFVATKDLLDDGKVNKSSKKGK